MNAIQIERHGGPDVLGYRQLSDPRPRQGEVVVEVEAAGVNFIDVYQREGLYQVPLPSVPGLEAAGVVAEVGPGVSAVAVGDRVAYTGVRGAYAERAAVPADRLVTVPEGLDLETAAALMLQGMTAHYLAFDSYALEPGDVCLVHAVAGGVGLLLTQIAKMRGARVIGTTSTEEKAARARSVGADEVILYNDEDFAQRVNDLTDGSGVEVIYDSVGKATFERGFGVLRPRGTMVLYGQSSGPVDPFDPQLLNQKGSLFLTRPSLGHHIATRDELERRAADVLGWTQGGTLQVHIDSSRPLSEAAQAHRRLEARESSGKLLLLP